MKDKFCLENYIRHSSFVIRNFSLVLITTLSLTLSGCVSYSFSGGGDIGGAKTLTIKNFYNDAGNGPASLSQTFTEKLRDFYQRNTKLTLVKSGGDWELEGRIVGYTVTSMAPTEAGTAALNRLTIRVVTNFTNRLEENAPDEIKSFENKEFNFYSDFKSGQSVSQVENEKIEEISNGIILQIFNATTSNW